MSMWSVITRVLLGEAEEKAELVKPSPIDIALEDTKKAEFAAEAASEAEAERRAKERVPMVQATIKAVSALDGGASRGKHGRWSGTRVIRKGVPVVYFGGGLNDSTGAPLMDDSVLYDPEGKIVK